MRKRDVMWAKLTNGKRKKEVRTYQCMINFTIDSMDDVDDVCVDDGLVGEGGRAMGSSSSERYGWEAHRYDENRDQAW
jgi:hypothetical protein